MQLRDTTETLLNVANYLEAGLPNDAPRIGHINFDLSIPGDVKDCGSVACIGGMAYMWENPEASIKEASHYVGDLPLSDPLAKLFYPQSDTGFPDSVWWNEVTPADASRAIRRYVYGEKMIWDHINPAEYRKNDNA